MAPYSAVLHRPLKSPTSRPLTLQGDRSSRSLSSSYNNSLKIAEKASALDDGSSDGSIIPPFYTRQSSQSLETSQYQARVVTAKLMFGLKPQGTMAKDSFAELVKV